MQSFVPDGNVGQDGKVHVEINEHGAQVPWYQVRDDTRSPAVTARHADGPATALSQGEEPA